MNLERIRNRTALLCPIGNLAFRTKAIAQLMHATRIESIFMAEQFQELFFRIQLIYPELKLAQNFRKKDYLINYNMIVKGFLSLADFTAHLGLDMSGEIKGMPRENWLHRIDECRESSLSYAFKKCFQEDLYYSSSKPMKPKGHSLTLTDVCPSPKEIADAEQFAALLVKQIPAEFFEEYRNDMARSLYKMIAHKKAIAKGWLPEFRLELIPLEIQHGIFERLKVYYDQLAFDAMARFSKLVWLHANGFDYYTEDDIFTFDQHYNNDGLSKWLENNLGLIHYYDDYELMGLSDFEDELIGIYPPKC
jgi:hypothetical protein